MKRAIVFNIEKFATHDGPGIRTVVFLKGCPLRCMWCHSPESWSFEVERYPDGEVIGREMSSEDVLAEVLKDKDFYDVSDGGLTVSGGEPLARPAFLAELLGKAKAAGLHTAVETSGAATEKVFEPLLPLVDLWLWDVKKLDADKHFTYTKRPLAQILANLRRVNDALAAESPRKRSIVLRCPMIPGINDGAEDIEAVGRLADSLPAVIELHVAPYIPYGIDKARRLGLKVYEAPQPPPEYGRRIVAALTRHTAKPVRLP
ncbi:MAG TPA: radical SAM protein [Kiritimatiellia bacterium]|nr:radical SAM protein [Kiritimatiellia bacterium]HOR97868.1 radical SAM protein [Kiritimatiellia bacterium]